MEPLGSTSASPESAIPLDPGVQESAQALADDLDNQPGSPPADAPVQAQPPAPSPGFSERHQKFMGGYRGRIQRERADLGRLRSIEERYTASRAEDNRLLQAAVEALKARGGPQVEKEPIPDPVMNPEGFQEWANAQQGKTINEALKPVMEIIKRQEDRFAQIEQSREQQAQEQQRTQAAIRQFETWEKDYQEQSPEIAAGVRDRYTSIRSAFSKAMEFAGVEPELRDGLAERHLFAVASGADSAGDNGLAAIDGFAYGLYQQFYEMVRADVAQDGIQLPPFGGGPSAPAAQPAVQTEISRLQAVQTRSAPAGNAAPRVAARATAGGSETERLFRGGVTDHRQLQAAALRETGGNMMAAQELLGRLVDQMA